MDKLFHKYHLSCGAAPRTATPPAAVRVRSAAAGTKKESTLAVQRVCARVAACSPTPAPVLNRARPVRSERDLRVQHAMGRHLSPALGPDVVQHAVG